MERKDAAVAALQTAQRPKAVFRGAANTSTPAQDPAAPQVTAPHEAPLAWKLAARTVLCLSIAAVTTYLYSLIFDLHHKSYGDGPMLVMCERLRAEPISADWMRQPPYTLSCYGPAFYYTANAVARLGGWHNSLVPGRLVALAATLLAAGLAAVAAGRKTRSVEIGLLAALMFLVSLPVDEWVPYARVDTLALAFAAGAYLAVGEGRRRLAVSALCVALGSLAKPTTSLAAVPIFLHLLATRRYRDAGFFAVLVCALGGAAWGAVQWATNGFFLSAVLEGNVNPMQLWRGFFFGYQFLCCPLGAVATIVAVSMLLAAPQRFGNSLYSLGYLVALAIAATTVCKQGSELNYFLEAALVGSVAIAVDGIPQLSRFGARRSLAAMAVLGVVLVLPTVQDMRVFYRSPREPMPYELVRECVENEPADVEMLADGRMIDLLLSAGRRPWLNDSYLYMLLVENGTLDSAPLLERLRDGRIKWLFLRKPMSVHVEADENGTRCWPKAAIDLFASHYELTAKKDGLWAYRHIRYGDKAVSGR
jgi:hypothetical protein